MKGVLLAGGTGTRLHPLSSVTNKHLLPVYDRPMIFWGLETIAAMGIKECLVVLGGRSVGDIVELLSDGSAFGLDLTYRHQRTALGIAHAIGLARSFVGDDSFAALLGDNVIHSHELRAVIDGFAAGPWEAQAVLHRVAHPERFGVAVFDEYGTVVEFEEKPLRPQSDWIPIGLYLFRNGVFDIIDGLQPSDRGELEITDVLNYYLRAGVLGTTVFSGAWHDAGSIQSLHDASNVAATLVAEHQRASAMGKDPDLPDEEVAV